MVGYVQSRGRARHHTSTFVVLVEEGNAYQLARYQALKESEPELRLIYQARDTATGGDSFEDDDAYDSPLGERYVVPTTGAILSYATATSLLNRLCALIPRDTFTPPQVPRYAGDFVSTLTLPASLPLPQELLTFTGPEKPTKREAKRAAAFMAVKRLHELNVFDDYMLPSKGSRARVYEDADGRPVPSTKNLPDMLRALVRDPWVLSDKLFLHVVHVDGVPTAGLLTGSSLPQVEMVIQDTFFTMQAGTPFEIQQPQKWDKLRMLQDYTRAGVWWCVTHRNISAPITACMFPLTESLLPDFSAIQETVDTPFGSHDWSTIGEWHHDNLLVMNGKVHGRPLLLRSIRRDLTPISPPAPGSREASFPTYREYWIQKYTRKGVEPTIPTDCPLIEIQHFPREQSSYYSTESLCGADGSQPPAPVGAKSFLPVYLCRQLPIPKAMWKTFRILPVLMRRATDLWRARQAAIELSLPPIQLHILAEALTLPCANASFDNQRLETLGDSVLKLCTVVYIFHKFPFRHEGQLDAVRRCCVSNRTLHARAQAIGLERFLTPEIQSVRVWPYTIPDGRDSVQMGEGRLVERAFPRRSLQECMESTLGAAFLSGGIPTALRAGAALGLSFGGSVPWPLRYGWRIEHVKVSPLFASLTERLGYEFKCGNLLIEAVSHPSFQYTSLPSYQRLEFLGDGKRVCFITASGTHGQSALIELVIMRYLYHRFPKATSGDLTTAKGRLVRNSALASLAVKKLELHKVILLNNATLSSAIWSYAKLLRETSYTEIVINGWKYEPPKALGDVFESVMGAVFVDSGHNFEKFSVIVEMIMEELLDEIEMDLPLDPVSNLMIWMSKNGCRRVNFQYVLLQNSPLEANGNVGKRRAILRLKWPIQLS
jgi:endoribonuclease Dicer